ncbi:Alcohol dehydrogenase [hydrothermal vent metagenome]|uniref:Alcohol dehydrogenase n=1 Tax=hydrothermal vent metagenome TaxID=652676 RepID=A0A3B1CL88_9ZZZZ
MKAVRFHAFGGPEKLLYEDAAKPIAGPSEVLVQVKACALNHLDLWIREGVPAYNTPLPHISGCDVSGVVDALGTEVAGEVSEIEVGSRVFIAPGLSCFKCAYCLSGADHLCDSYQIFGASTDGGYAEFVKVPQKNVIPIPDTLSFEDAAAFPLTFLTAWHMLISRAALRPGQDLLVLAGGSGVGSAAIQIGKLAGARVFATASSAEKLARAQEMGADFLINHSEGNFAKTVLKLTKGRGVDVVFEHPGPLTFGKSLFSLAKGGTLVTCGATTGPKVDLDLRYIFSRELNILGAKMGRRAELLHVAKLVGQGKLKPVIDSVFPLSEARVAQEKMVSRKLFGKVLLKPSF